MKLKDRLIKKENRREANRTPLLASEIQSIVRRMGVVMLRAHEVMMSALIAQGDARVAEALNDSLKPAIDYLLHFNVMDEVGSRDTTPEDE